MKVVLTLKRIEDMFLTSKLEISEIRIFWKSQNANHIRWKNRRANHRRCSVKKGILTGNSQENICARDCFLIKLQAWGFVKKESLAQVFSCDFCEISKNNFFTKHLRAITSKNIYIYTGSTFGHNNCAKYFSSLNYFA